MYFLWNFWIRDLFNPAVRVTLPDFQGQNYDTVSMDPDYLSTYSFHVLYLVDTDHAPGTILSQSPNPGRSIMMTPGGVEVNLSVVQIMQNVNHIIVQILNVLNKQMKDVLIV